MKTRKAIGRLVPGFCAILTVSSLLAGCGTQTDVANHGSVPASKSVLIKPDTVKTPARQTPRTTYDRAFITTVQQHWFDILDQESSVPTNGTVVLEFKLSSDGRISDMKVKTNTVNAQAAADCQRAVLEPSPYPAWPEDMRNDIGKDSRKILFTFYYDQSKPKSALKLQL